MKTLHSWPWIVQVLSIGTRQRTTNKQILDPVPYQNQAPHSGPDSRRESGTRVGEPEFCYRSNRFWGAKIRCQNLVLHFGTKILYQNVVSKYCTRIKHQNKQTMVTSSGPKIWDQNLVSQSGTRLWLQNLVPESDADAKSITSITVSQ